MDNKQKDDFIESEIENIGNKENVEYDEVDTNHQDEPIPDDKSSDTKKGGIKRTIMELLIYAAVLFVCVFIVPRYVIQRTVVDGPSMMNTLHSGENLIVDKVTYHISDPKRFDIIMFYPYGRDQKDYYVKRVIGLPGETIQIIGSDIYINNKKLEEHYGKDPITESGIAAEPIKLGKDEYFVLGDNRKVSEDSRYEEVGPVKRDLIEGKCLIRVWPLNKFGTVK
ncbi:signal peptidase I [Anaeromicropila herbilytica]|uniref:Signal peptidase I n=1 Tax=Anaeromicropila herbilytica TaxID=2785025 RepID=A0A7R7EMK4_9FIRM|nr:signal peptidase I [Anaeromicropila herbilytica]BCN31584.1 signal peptidase I [Anaeromicropila herbilytica]